MHQKTIDPSLTCSAPFLALLLLLCSAACSSSATDSHSNLGGTGGVAAGGFFSSGGATAGANAAGAATSGSSGQGENGGSGESASAGSAGLGAGGSAGSAGSAGEAAGGAAGVPMHQEFLLYDDSKPGRLLYVNNAKPSANWVANSGIGRDLQLVGGGRALFGKSDGWDEYRLIDGAKVGGRHGFAGTDAAYRLADGTTLLASVSGNSILLKMVDSAGVVARQITYPGFAYVRLVRPTLAGTFLVCADTVAFEGDGAGKVLWKVNVNEAAVPPAPLPRHIWKAMRLPNGNTAIASGYGATLLIYDGAGKLLQTMGGVGQPQAAAIAPWFYADFHVLPNGNFFIANSQADRIMDNSIQLLEYDPAGVLVWQQKQPVGVHSVEEAFVLDGLDTSKLQIEPEGRLISAP